MFNECIAQTAKYALQSFGMVDVDGQKVAVLSMDAPRWIDHMVDFALPDVLGVTGIVTPIKDILQAIVTCNGDIDIAEQLVDPIDVEFGMLDTVIDFLTRYGSCDLYKNRTV